MPSTDAELRNTDLRVLRQACKEAATVQNLWKPDIRKLATATAENGETYSEAYIYKTLARLEAAGKIAKWEGSRGCYTVTDTD